MAPKPRYIPENVTQTLNPSDAPHVTIYLYTTKQGRPAAIAYHDKKSKPILNCAYHSEAQRLDHLNRERTWWAEEYRQRQAHEAERKAKTELKPGDIVYCTWGYDQTNVDFYEVIEVSKSGKSATIRHLKIEATERNSYHMTGKAIPIPGQYDSPPATFRTFGKDRINTERSQYAARAQKWDGRPVSYSWYA